MAARLPANAWVLWVDGDVWLSEGPARRAGESIAELVGAETAGRGVELLVGSETEDPARTGRECQVLATENGELRFNAGVFALRLSPGGPELLARSDSLSAVSFT